MPRSIQVNLDHADELAKRFEDYEPDPSDERPVEEYLLDRAALAVSTAETTTIVVATPLDGRQEDDGVGSRRCLRSFRIQFVCPLCTIDTVRSDE